MNEIIKKVKENETPPKIIKNLFDKNEIENFLQLYKNLPVTVHNKKQNVIKKRWLQGYNKDLEKLFVIDLRLKLVILKWIILSMKMEKKFMV